MTSTGLDPAEDGEPLLGAYVSCPMSPPAPGVRGSPEAFVFRICAHSAAADAHFGLPALAEVDEASGHIFAYKFESVSASSTSASKYAFFRHLKPVCGVCV
jgi:hypothetical protein